MIILIRVIGPRTLHLPRTQSLTRSVREKKLPTQSRRGNRAAIREKRISAENR
uniref:Uncharacterized protein n=1 Tax=Oryza brachyantha TaxID=4533 RepID=J3MTP5_ORYBR